MDTILSRAHDHNSGGFRATVGTVARNFTIISKYLKSVDQPSDQFVQKPLPSPTKALGTRKASLFKAVHKPEGLREVSILHASD